MAKKTTKKTKKVAGVEVAIEESPVPTPATDNWSDGNYLKVYLDAKRGLQDRSIAEHLKCSLTTFKKWLKEKYHFRLAFEQGREASVAGKWEHLKANQRSFLVAYARSGTIATAASVSGIMRKQHYRWLKQDHANGIAEHENSYTQAFFEAKEDSIDLLVEAARSRAVDGVKRYKFYKGMPIMIPCQPHEEGAIEALDDNGNVCYLKPYVEHEYSDTLLCVLLKAGRPEEFRDGTQISLNQTTAVNLNSLLEEVESEETRIIDADYINRAAQQVIEDHSN